MTPTTPSDTPESVAALDARVEEVLETCAARPSIVVNATGLLSNFIGCVEKGRGSALDAGDGRAARFALDLLERRDRAQAAEIARLSSNHKAELIEIGDAAGADLRHHSDALLHYSAVASVKRLRDERNGLLNDIDDAWEAFGTAGNRGVLTLAEQIVSLDRELDAALARATSAEAALAASEERVRGLREATQPIADAFRAMGADLLVSDLDICRIIAPHITVAQMQAFCATVATGDALPTTQPEGATDAA